MHWDNVHLEFIAEELPAATQYAQALSPLILLANWMSLGMMVTLLAWIACKQKLQRYGWPTISQKNGITYAKIGVLEETDKVSFTSFLQCHDSRALEPQVGLEILGDLANQALEGELANEQLCRFLVPGELEVEVKEFKGNISMIVPTFWSPSGQQAQACSGGASSHRQWQGRTSLQPWWPTAS